MLYRHCGFLSGPWPCVCFSVSWSQIRTRRIHSAVLCSYHVLGAVWVCWGYFKPCGVRPHMALAFQGFKACGREGREDQGPWYQLLLQKCLEAPMEGRGGQLTAAGLGGASSPCFPWWQPL